MIHGIVAQGVSASGGTPSFGSHRYWRLLIYSGAPNQINISEIQFLLNGVNQATGGTAIHNGESSGFPASNAFDGNLTSRWVSSPAVSPKPETPLWIGYDFGVTKEVDAVSVHSHVTANGPRDFFVQHSDDNITWVSAFEVRNQLDWTAGETRVLTVTHLFPTPMRTGFGVSTSRLQTVLAAFRWRELSICGTESIMRCFTTTILDLAPIFSTQAFTLETPMIQIWLRGISPTDSRR